MTLDDAIEHAKERGQIRDACGLEHLQLAGWLSELDQTRKRNAELGRENVKLRELCGELLRMAESNDPDFLHWPELHDELRKLGVKVNE